MRGDIGGFGIGSQFTWQAIATYNWFLFQHDGLTVDGYAGWKALLVDYDEGTWRQPLRVRRAPAGARPRSHRPLLSYPHNCGLLVQEHQVPGGLRGNAR